MRFQDLAKDKIPYRHTHEIFALFKLPKTGSDEVKKNTVHNRDNQIARERGFTHFAYYGKELKYHDGWFNRV